MIAGPYREGFMYVSSLHEAEQIPFRPLLHQHEAHLKENFAVRIER